MKSKLMAFGIVMMASVALLFAGIVAEDMLFKGKVDFDNGSKVDFKGTIKIDGTEVTATAAQLNLLKSRAPVTASASTAKVADALMSEYSATRTTATSTWETVLTAAPVGFVTVGGVVSTNVATFTSNGVTIVFGTTGITYNVFYFGAKSN